MVYYFYNKGHQNKENSYIFIRYKNINKEIAIHFLYLLKLLSLGFPSLLILELNDLF